MRLVFVIQLIGLMAGITSGVLALLYFLLPEETRLGIWALINLVVSFNLLSVYPRR